MGSATIRRDFHKHGFPQLSEHGANIGHTKVYNEVCLRRTSTSKH